MAEDIVTPLSCTSVTLHLVKVRNGTGLSRRMIGTHENCDVTEEVTEYDQCWESRDRN